MLRASEGERDPLTGTVVPVHRFMLAHRSADASVSQCGAGDVLRVLRVCERGVLPVLRCYPLRYMARGADKRDCARVPPIGGYRIGAGMWTGTHRGSIGSPMPLFKTLTFSCVRYHILT